jgi:DNA-binding NtrC family response regulator
VLLVVDDSRNIREFCRRELEREGHRVLLAKDPLEGLAILEAQRPDVVVMDVAESPGPDLPAFLSRVGNRDVPVVVHTCDLLRLSEAPSWPVEARVEKSGDLADLKREIARILERRAANSAVQENREPVSSREREGRSWDEDGID